MAFNNSFKFAPAEWLPFKDGEAVAAALNIDLRERQGKNFENPDFELASFAVGELEVNGGMLTLLPHIHGTDGFFVAKIRRKNQ